MWNEWPNINNIRNAYNYLTILSSVFRDQSMLSTWANSLKLRPCGIGGGYDAFGGGTRRLGAPLERGRGAHSDHRVSLLLAAEATVPIPKPNCPNREPTGISQKCLGRRAALT